jgi:hypothetical protein
MAIDLVQHPAVEGAGWWRVVHFGVVGGTAVDRPLEAARREIELSIERVGGEGWVQVGGVEEIAAIAPGAGEIAMLRVPFADLAAAARLTRRAPVRRPASDRGKRFVGSSYVLARSEANPDLSSTSLDAESRFWRVYASANPLAGDDNHHFAAELYLAFDPWNHDECAVLVRAELP